MVGSGADRDQEENPTRTAQQWDITLKQCDFSGAKIIVNDSHADTHVSTLMVSEAVSSSSNSAIPEIQIVHLSKDSLIEHFSHHLLDELDNRQLPATKTTSLPLAPFSTGIYVVLDLASDPVLANLTTPNQWQTVVSFLRSAQNVLWVTIAGAASSVDASKGLVTGLIRSAQAENRDLKLVTIDVHDVEIFNLHLLSTVTEILVTSFQQSSDETVTTEREYAYDAAGLQIPRLIPYTRLNAEINTAAGYAPTTQRPFLGLQNILQLLPNDRLDVVFQEVDKPQSPLGAQDVEISVAALCVDGTNVLVTQGQKDPQTALFECAGYVTAVGSSIVGIKAGDRVCALTKGPIANSVRVSSSAVALLPVDLAFELGASMPIDFATGFHCLNHIAKLTQEQTLLILAGSKGSGQALLSLARNLKVKVVAHVDSVEDRDMIMHNFGLPLESVIIANTSSLSSKVRGLTNGKGVDAVVNCLDLGSSDQLDEIYACLRPYGTFVQLEDSSLNRNTSFRRHPLPKNMTYVSFNFAEFLEARAPMAVEAFRKAMELLRDSTMSLTHSLISMPVRDIEVAFRTLAKDEPRGKLILRVDPGDEVRTLRSRQIHLKLDGDATYVVAGGLGDLGQKICILLAERGARSVVVLSRRKSNSKSAVSLAERVQSLVPSCKLYCIECDIGLSGQVEQAASRLDSLQLPPVKGVIQSTVVLRVSR